MPKDYAFCAQESCIAQSLEQYKPEQLQTVIELSARQRCYLVGVSLIAEASNSIRTLSLTITRRFPTRRSR
jgi:hypothetical protein